MHCSKLLILVAFSAFVIAACKGSEKGKFVISNSKSFEASLFRQNCAICHGPEANGRTLDDGTIVPGLREPPFKYKTDGEIYDHIANGGNGMVPFRDQLTERELRMMVEFVQKDLRANVR